MKLTKPNKRLKMPERFTMICKMTEADGRKYFLDGKTGLIAVADWSGDYPHQTDDGVLLIPEGAKLKIVTENGTTDVVESRSIPVINDGGEDKGTIMLTKREHWWLVGMGFEVDIEEADKRWEVELSGHFTYYQYVDAETQEEALEIAERDFNEERSGIGIDLTVDENEVKES